MKKFRPVSTCKHETKEIKCPQCGVEGLLIPEGARHEAAMVRRQEIKDGKHSFVPQDI